MTSACDSILHEDDIIIVDDGSDEDEYEYLRKTVEGIGHPGIRLIRHDINRGGAAARNSGVRESRKNWIFNLDADNVIDEDLVHKLRDFALSNEVDVACPSTIHFFRGEITDVTHDWVFVERDLTFLDHLRSPYVPSSSGNYLFSRTAFERAGGFPEFAGGLDAWGFGLRMVATGSRMKICPATSYFHRFGHDSYYVRESRRADKQSLVATSLILEFSDLTSPRIIRKLLSHKHRVSWYSKLQANPFRIKGLATGKVISY